MTGFFFFFNNFVFFQFLIASFFFFLLQALGRKMKFLKERKMKGHVPFAGCLKNAQEMSEKNNDSARAYIDFIEKVNE